MKYREEGKWVELTNENYFKLSKEQLIIALGTIIMEHKKAQQKIDKAIEYLKDNACYENTISELFCDDLDTDSCMELLDILRG